MWHLNTVVRQMNQNLHKLAVRDTLLLLQPTVICRKPLTLQHHYTFTARQADHQQVSGTYLWGGGGGRTASGGAQGCLWKCGWWMSFCPPSSCVLGRVSLPLCEHVFFSHPGHVAAAPHCLHSLPATLASAWTHWAPLSPHSTPVTANNSQLCVSLCVCVWQATAHFQLERTHCLLVHWFIFVTDFLFSFVC